jgi:hypothetical protein
VIAVSKSKKPTVTLRRPAPVPEERARELENRWDAAGQRTAGTSPTSVQTSKRPSASESAEGDRRVVVRKGRIRADGSRTEAPPRLRLTVYLPPELGRALDVHAASTGRERSTIIAEALAAYLERSGQ